MSSMIRQVRVNASRAAYGVAVYTWRGSKILTAWANDRPRIYNKETATIIAERYSETQFDGVFVAVPLPYAGNGHEIDQ